MPGGGDDHYPRDVRLPRGSGLPGQGRWNLYAGLLEVTVLLFNFSLPRCVLVSCLGYSISVDSWEGGGSSKILLTSKKDNKFNFFFFSEFRIQNFAAIQHT